ncbi:tyrosine-protein phosphatase non-receptor type substrate 1-like [Protopterus annectens]|uniref:tyrosine-protein phosphatase non-receptor type substrate 1-like n=1 Tax=Protopterus annectens TaxID=7888 RepID=UPI001CFAE273|nr:tyrosine-protein phosphatase non-receptor type substrate 1-like [Protopterus annectens]
MLSVFNTNDIVKGIPSHPSISGPTEQTMINKNVTLSCTSEGFYPKEINITWLQNGMEVLNSAKIAFLNMTDKTYHVQSNITFPAKIDSPVICRITHTALELPINSTFQMNNIVKEPSTPSISGSKMRTELNESLTLTCKSEGFYPKNISVTWWQYETELQGPKTDVTSYGVDKTYKVESSITIPAKIDSFVTCRIHHTALDRPINSTFRINDIIKDPFDVELPIKIGAAGAACGLLAVIFISTFAVLHHRKRKKGKNNTTNGSVTTHREAENKQDENNDSITYATLQLREGPSMPKKVVQEEATEYAEVHFKRVPNNDVTYADVSITKLRTKEAISHYYIEEHGTEYATVKKKTKPSN